MSCDKYWKIVCSSGMSAEVLKQEKEVHGSYSAVAIKWKKQEFCLRNCISHSEMKYPNCVQKESGNMKCDERGGGRKSGTVPFGESTATEVDGDCTYVLVHPVCNGFCIKVANGVSPCLSLLRMDGNMMCECAVLENIFPCGLFEVIWSWSTPTKVLLHGNNATWVEFIFSSGKPLGPPAITEWEDSIVSNVYNVFSCCAACSLVVIMAKILSSDKRWEMKLLELQKEPTNSISFRLTVDFMPEPSLTDDPFFKVNKIHVYPSEVDRDTRCRNHNVLVQFGSVIVQFRIEKLEPEYKISDPIKILCPSEDPVFYSVDPLKGTFALSRDHKLVALVTKTQTIHSHIWNLESGSYQQAETMVDCSRIRFVDSIGVGHLYTLVAVRTHLKEISVMVLRTASASRLVAEVIYRTKYSLSSSSFLETHSLGSEEWMNSVAGVCDLTELFCVSVSRLKPIQEVSLVKYVMHHV